MNHPCKSSDVVSLCGSVILLLLLLFGWIETVATPVTHSRDTDTIAAAAAADADQCRRNDNEIMQKPIMNTN